MDAETPAMTSKIMVLSEREDATVVLNGKAPRARWGYFQ